MKRQKNFVLRILLIITTLILILLEINEVEGKSLVIGHRGAPAYRPEETFSSYELAVNFNVDFIETDLCLTSDLQLVCFSSFLFFLY